VEFANSAKMGGAEVLEAKPKPECHPHILQYARVELPEFLLIFPPSNGLAFIHSSHPTFWPGAGLDQVLRLLDCRLEEGKESPAA
jgi:hypothetical protein